jgi:hypothetical protein
MFNESDLGTLIRLLHPEQPESIRFAEINLAEGSGALSKLECEIDTYPGEWDFKGEVRGITRRVRIRYDRRSGTLGSQNICWSATKTLSRQQPKHVSGTHLKW